MSAAALKEFRALIFRIQTDATRPLQQRIAELEALLRDMDLRGTLILPADIRQRLEAALGITTEGE